MIDAKTTYGMGVLRPMPRGKIHMAIGNTPAGMSAEYLMAFQVKSEVTKQATAYSAPVRVQYTLDDLAWEVRIGIDPHIYKIPTQGIPTFTDKEDGVRKSELIRLVDSILFANLQRKILEIYERARVINGGGAFKYHFFADPSAKYHFLRPPSEETISFLFQHVRELQPAIENRQAINYLVIRFLNEARQPYAVLKLLPLSVLSTDIKDVLRDLILSDSDENLLKVFIESPEYNLLKRQVVFNTME